MLTGASRAARSASGEVLAEHQPEAERASADGAARRTQLLALLRGALLDLLATGDRDRITTAVTRAIAALQQSH